MNEEHERKSDEQIDRSIIQAKLIHLYSHRESSQIR